MTLHVDLAEGGAAFASLRGEWDELAADSHATVFSRWEWLFPWWSQLACNARPLLLTVRDAEARLRGLLPVLEERRGPLRRWSLLGGRWVGSDGLGPLFASGWERTAGAALAQRLALESSRWQLLDLAGLSAELPWLTLLRGALRERGIESQLGAGDVCPSIRLRAEVDPLVQNPRRENFERRKRWIAREPSSRVDCAADATSIDAALTDFLDVHGLRWRETSDAIPGGAVVRFHREAAALLAEQGLCRVYLLWLHGRPVAAVYALVDRRAFYYYLPAFDPAWAHRSVGTVLLGLLIRGAREEGLERFELLRGEESYKGDWADARWRTVRLRAAAPSFAARVVGRLDRWQRGVRAVASRALPTGAVERWRTALARRSLRASDSG